MKRPRSEIQSPGRIDKNVTLRLGNNLITDLPDCLQTRIFQGLAITDITKLVNIYPAARVLWQRYREQGEKHFKGIDPMQVYYTMCSSPHLAHAADLWLRSNPNQWVKSMTAELESHLRKPFPIPPLLETQNRSIQLVVWVNTQLHTALNIYIHKRLRQDGTDGRALIITMVAHQSLEYTAPASERKLLIAGIPPACNTDKQIPRVSLFEAALAVIRHHEIAVETYTVRPSERTDYYTAEHGYRRYSIVFSNQCSLDAHFHCSIASVLFAGLTRMLPTLVQTCQVIF
jgi:hypothetical protein